MANMAGKVDAMLKWAKTYEPLNDFLKLNAILNEEDDATLVPVPNSKADEQPFIDGTARRRRIFMLRIMLPWSDGYDPTNQQAEKVATEWRDWVDEQFPDNVPDFGGAEIEGIEALTDMPTVEIYQEESLAEYNFQAQITYIE